MKYKNNPGRAGIEDLAPEPGFEPGSKPRQGFMIGLYTIRTRGGYRF